MQERYLIYFKGKTELNSLGQKKRQSSLHTFEDSDLHLLLNLAIKFWSTSSVELRVVWLTRMLPQEAMRLGGSSRPFAWKLRSQLF